MFSFFAASSHTKTINNSRWTLSFSLPSLNSCVEEEYRSATESLPNNSSCSSRSMRCLLRVPSWLAHPLLELPPLLLQQQQQLLQVLAARVVSFLVVVVVASYTWSISLRRRRLFHWTFLFRSCSHIAVLVSITILVAVLLLLLLSLLLLLLFKGATAFSYFRYYVVFSVNWLQPPPIPRCPPLLASRYYTTSKEKGK